MVNIQITGVLNVYRSIGENSSGRLCDPEIPAGTLRLEGEDESGVSVQEREKLLVETPNERVVTLEGKEDIDSSDEEGPGSLRGQIHINKR